MIKKLLIWLKNDFKDLHISVKAIIRHIRFKRIKKEADKLAKYFNEQIFVLKVDGQITYVSKYQFKKLRQGGKFPLDFTATNLKEIALYITPKPKFKNR